MKLRVRYTAQLRAAIHRTEEDVEMPEGSLLSELLLHLADRNDSGRRHLVTEEGQAHASLIIIVNESAVSARDASSVRLNDGNVVTLLPPIAGG